MNRTSPILAASLALALAACNGDRGPDAPSGDTGPYSSATDQPSAGHPTSGDAGGMQANTGSDPGSVGGMAPGMTGGMEPGMATDGSSLAAGDRRALMAVMEVDRHEIAASEAALAKDLGDEARRYAEMLRDDHTRNLEATTRLLGTQGDDAAPGASGASGAPGAPELATMTREHEAERQRLDTLEGEAFERAWIEAMAAGHAKALEMVDGQLLPGATDQQVSQHLQSSRDAIARHLEMARSLQGDGGGTGTGTGTR